jgi:hypothetical protein
MQLLGQNGEVGFSFDLQTACPAVSGAVQTCLALAQADLDAAHRKASPVENWGL